MKDEQIDRVLTILAEVKDKLNSPTEELHKALDLLERTIGNPKSFFDALSSNIQSRPLKKIQLSLSTLIDAKALKVTKEAELLAAVATVVTVLASIQTPPTEKIAVGGNHFDQSAESQKFGRPNKANQAAPNNTSHLSLKLTIAPNLGDPGALRVENSGPLACSAFEALRADYASHNTYLVNGAEPLKLRASLDLSSLDIPLG